MVTNVELDHHSRWGSRAELIEAFARFAARRSGLALGGPDLDPVADGSAPALRFDAEQPGPAARAARSRAATTCSTRAPRWRRSSSPGFELEPAAAALAGFPGMLRRQERKGTPRRGRDLRRLRPPPDRGRRDARGAARARAAAADRRLPAAPLLAHQGARRRASAPRSRPPTRSACSTSTPAREQPVGELAGVSGLTSPARRPITPAAGRCGGCATASTAERALAPRLREGDLLVTIGAGDVFQLAERLLVAGADERCPPGVERDYPLARLTTVRAGGNAELFARPATEGELVELLAWAAARGPRGRGRRLGLEPARRRRRRSRAWC